MLRCLLLPLLLLLLPMPQEAAGQAPEKEEGAEAAAAEPPAARLPPRPLLSRQEYLALATTLRRAYQKPPAEWPAPTLDPGVELVELGQAPRPEHPPENPYSKEKAGLGQMLFFDPRLSGTNEMACASCHDPDLSWADGRTVAFGRRRERLQRNSPSLLNVGLAKHLFWDGRATSLEDQALSVMANSHEMNGNGTEVVSRLNKHEAYRKAFAAAFGDERIDLPRVSQAIACFERMITTRRNAFDLFLSGNDAGFSDEAVRGLHLFRTQARCLNCHNGPNFTNGQFHNLGLSYYGRKFEDLGRYNITQKTEDVGRFKTPGLRNVNRTAPYMHVGFFSMDMVLRLYNAGMPVLKRKEEQASDPLFPAKDPLLRPLQLNTQDFADLKAFLETLDELPWRLRPPELPPHD